MRRSRYIRGKICFKLFQRWRLIAKLFVGCCNEEDTLKHRYGNQPPRLDNKKNLTICHSSPILVIDWIQFSIAYIKCKLNVRNDKKSVSPCCWLDGLLPTATLLHQVAVQLNNVHKRLRGTYFLRTVCARRLTFRSISYVNGADVFSILNLGVLKNLHVLLLRRFDLWNLKWKLKHLCKYLQRFKSKLIFSV